MSEIILGLLTGVIIGVFVGWWSLPKFYNKEAAQLRKKNAVQVETIKTLEARIAKRNEQIDKFGVSATIAETRLETEKANTDAVEGKVVELQKENKDLCKLVIDITADYNDGITINEEHMRNFRAKIKMLEGMLEELDDELGISNKLVDTLRSFDAADELTQANERIKLYDEAYAYIIASSKYSMVLKAIGELGKALVGLDQDIEGGLPWLKFNSLKIMGDLTMENQQQKECIAKLEKALKHLADEDNWETNVSNEVLPQLRYQLFGHDTAWEYAKKALH